MACHRLHIALQPILPLRTPDAYSKAVLHGFHLRVANGSLVAPEDPLLAAFGVIVTTLDDVCEHDEALQHDSLDPGHQLERVRLCWRDGYSWVGMRLLA